MPMCPPPYKSSSNNSKMTDSSSRNHHNILKSVKFDQVFIHEFPIILGDNPAVSKGAPITIDWKPMAHDVIDLDIYEYLREPERRHRKRMIMSNSKRAKILMNSGYSIDDIAEMTLQVEDAKRVRAENALESANQLSNNAWFKNLNNNIMELLSGAAENTGRTLFIAAPHAVIKGANKVGYEVVKGTGKVVVGTGKATTAVVMGTGKIITTTGKVSADIAVGTVKGTGKVVVGAGKATTAVVVGTGKLGYDVVKSTGKRMSKFMNLNDSTSKEILLDDLGYANPDGDDDDYDIENDAGGGLMGKSSNSTRDRRGSNDSRDRSSRDRGDRRGSNESRGGDRRGSNENRDSNIGKGTPAPQRMPRRGSANGSVTAQVARAAAANQQVHQQQLNTLSPPGKSGKSKRRGSGNSALAESFSSFTNIFTGRGVRRANSSSGGDKFNSGSSSRRTKSSDGTNGGGGGGGGGSGGGGGKRGDRRRRATLTSGAPTSPRLTKSANAATAFGGGNGPPGGFSELAQMEQFLHYVRESDPHTVNPIIGNAYGAGAGNNSTSSIDEYEDISEEDHLRSFDGSDPGHNRPNSVGRSRSAPETPLPQPPPSAAAEPVTPAA